VRLATLIVAAAVALPGAAHASFSFAVIGDTPYFELEVPVVRGMLAEIAREGAAFVVHVGDIKGGTSECSDEVLRERRALLDASPVPLIFVPGDNEWTDCYRRSAGAYQPRDKLRALFFDSHETLGGTKLRLARQSDDARFRAYRENARWVANNIVFITLNVPGSNNNFGRNSLMDAEHAERMAANLAWLREAVEVARQPDMRALVIFAHANPRLGRGPGPRDGYAGYREALRAHAATLGKPMLLVHGDGHLFFVDQPLRDPQTGNRIADFTRVQVFGSPVLDWVRIDVAPAGATLFSIKAGSATAVSQ
jgi:hypothetical protein